MIPISANTPMLVNSKQTERKKVFPLCSDSVRMTVPITVPITVRMTVPMCVHLHITLSIEAFR